MRAASCPSCLPFLLLFSVVYCRRVRGDTEDARVLTWSAQGTSSSALVSAARDLLTDNGVKRRVGRGEKTAACVRLALVHAAAAAVQRARMEGREKERGSGGFRSPRRPTTPRLPWGSSRSWGDPTREDPPRSCRLIPEWFRKLRQRVVGAGINRRLDIGPTYYSPLPHSRPWAEMLPLCRRSSLWANVRATWFLPPWFSYARFTSSSSSRRHSKRSRYNSIVIVSYFLLIYLLFIVN